MINIGKYTYFGVLFKGYEYPNHTSFVFPQYEQLKALPRNTEILDMMRLQILLTLVLIGPVVAGRGRRRRRRTQTICDDVPEAVTEDTMQCRPVTKERTKLRIVTKFNKGMKTVTRYEKATRLVNRTQMVEYLLPMEAFLLEAKQQIIWESQESLRRCGINSRSVNADVRFNETSAGTEALVLYGPSQGGKSTFVCQLRKAKDAACPKVGDGSGESMTDEPSLWETILGWVLDNPGNLGVLGNVF